MHPRRAGATYYFMRVKSDDRDKLTLDMNDQLICDYMSVKSNPTTNPTDLLVLRIARGGFIILLM